MIPLHNISARTSQKFIPAIQKRSYGDFDLGKAFLALGIISAVGGVVVGATGYALYSKFFSNYRIKIHIEKKNPTNETE